MQLQRSLFWVFLSLAACSAGGPPDPDDPNGPGGADLPCTPGIYRCDGGNAVEICNSSGSAWLYAETCAVSCNAGLCTGACTPTTRRCNMNKVEECNGAGTAWSLKESCTSFCASAQCALAGLEVTMSRSLDGEVIVDGDVIVRSGATLSSPRGDLTLRARSITVENGASIAASPTGDVREGRGDEDYRSGGGGGSYGGAGGWDTGGNASPGSVYGSDSDATVQRGAKGGDNIDANGGKGGAGGGVLRLLAETSISVAGLVTANGAGGTPARNSDFGGGGGGSGGGILLGAGTDLSVSGTVSAQGMGGGAGYYVGGKGGDGRVKLLAGGKRTITGMVSGKRSEGLLPPLLITSASHPDPTLIYNDDFPSVDVAWSRPFPSRQGYYHKLTTAHYYGVPTPATAAFLNSEMVMLPPMLSQGNNYFRLVSVDSVSNVGTIESILRIQINTWAPTVSSMSHPTPSAWSANKSPLFQWVFPVEDRNVKGAHYVFDHFGDTVPTKTATFVPAAQKQQLISDVAPGLWVMHVVSLDQRGYLTKKAGHYRVNIGDDPGTGVVLGKVVDMGNKPVDGATVTINRGLFTQTTNATGNFNLPAVVTGSWELRVSKAGFMGVTKMVDVTKGGFTTANVTLN